MDLVTCKSCNSKVSPRLWHYKLMFRNITTQHLYNICGVVMYESGGGFTLKSKVIGGFFVIFLILPLAPVAIGRLIKGLF